MRQPNDAPLLLDLFAGAGGAGEGYARAGFRVVGCDLNAKCLKHNPHECYESDALEALHTLLAGDSWRGYGLDDFAAIHASPPCQAYSRSTQQQRNRGKVYPDLVGHVRRLLMATGLPWIIENVPGAPLHAPIMLCGSMFGLRVQRHRLFEAPCLAPSVLFAPATCRHDGHAVIVAGHGTPSWPRKRYGIAGTKSEWVAAMGIDWMNRDELAQAIPPAYTAWLGAQLLTAVRNQHMLEVGA